MNPSVAGNDPVVVDRVRFACKTGHPSSRLRHKQLSGCDIPGFQLALPEAVQPPGSDIRQVESSRAGSSDPAPPHLEVGKMGKIVLPVGSAVIGKAGGKKRAAQGRAYGGPYRRAVQPGAFTPDGSEHLVHHRMVDDTQNDLSPDLECYRHGKPGEPVGKVGSAVERIDDPLVARFSVRIKVLLCQKIMPGESLCQPLDNQLFGFLVDLGYQIDLPFVLHIKRFPDHRALVLSGLSGQGNGFVLKILHGRSHWQPLTYFFEINPEP